MAFVPVRRQGGWEGWGGADVQSRGPMRLPCFLPQLGRDTWRWRRKEGKGGESRAGLPCAARHGGTTSLPVPAAPQASLRAKLAPGTRDGMPPPASPPPSRPKEACLPPRGRPAPPCCPQWSLGHWVACHLSQLPPCSSVPSWVLSLGSVWHPIFLYCPCLLPRPAWAKSRWCLWTLREKIEGQRAQRSARTWGATCSPGPSG